MKILHALVGYLAVSSLPFHPFAFASPLEIDYDGYVNMQNHTDNALMKHILDSIVETCQTQAVTTKNYSDTALMKRVPGDIIEARQEGDPPEGIPIPWVIAIIIGAAVLSLIWLSTDHDVRGNDVEFLVEH